MALELVTNEFTATERSADNAIAIAFLESALARAKEGHVTLALVVMLCDDNSVFDGWSVCSQAQPYTMIGALEEVKLRYRDINVQQRS